MPGPLEEEIHRGKNLGMSLVFGSAFRLLSPFLCLIGVGHIEGFSKHWLNESNLSVQGEAKH